MLSTLRHENIVCFLAACTVPPNICIIEELAHGGSLHGLLHGSSSSFPPSSPSSLSSSGRRQRVNKPLPMQQLLNLATDVASAMSYLHPKIVHRDLKAQVEEGGGG